MQSPRSDILAFFGMGGWFPRIPSSTFFKDTLENWEGVMLVVCIDLTSSSGGSFGQHNIRKTLKCQRVSKGGQ